MTGEVQEIAAMLGVSTPAALTALRRMDEFVLSGASVLAPEVSQRLVAYFVRHPPTAEQLRHADEPLVVSPLAHLGQSSVDKADP